MTGRIQHTGYTVSNLERSIAFYSGLLGLEVVATQEKQGGYLGVIVGFEDAHVRMAHLRMPGGEHVIELFQYVAPAHRPVQRAEPPDVGASHLCISTDDLEGLYDRLVADGVDSFISAPVLIDTGFNRGGYGLYLRDPDGMLIELFQPPAR